MGYDFKDAFDYDDNHGLTTFIIIACSMFGVFVAIVATIIICRMKGKCGGGRGPMYQS